MKTTFSSRTSIYPLVLLLLCIGIVTVNGQELEPRSYIAYKATEKLNIDGHGNDASSQKAPWSQDYIDIEGKKVPDYRTRMKMLWDNEYLYVLTEMEAPNVWATLKQRDTVIFYNNDYILNIM